jgi:hypothetical protein
VASPDHNSHLVHLLPPDHVRPGEIALNAPRDLLEVAFMILAQVLQERARAGEDAVGRCHTGRGRS